MIDCAQNVIDGRVEASEASCGERVVSDPACAGQPSAFCKAPAGPRNAALAIVIGLAFFALPAHANAAPEEDSSGADPDATVRTFLDNYCVRCHGSELQKGDRRFDRLPANIDSSNTLVDFQDILDQLNLSEMPPEDAKQPTFEERRTVIQLLTSRIAKFHRSRKPDGRGTVLRRLNAREYRNTIRDLFCLNMTMFDPTEAFPRDQTTEHLDNVGETLVTSSYLLQQHLAAADRIVEKALFPLQRPPVQRWEFRDGFRQQPEIDQVHRKTNFYEHMTLYDVIGADKHEGAYGPIHAFAEGVPHDGYYDLRLKVEALNRNHPYDDDIVGTDKNELFRLGIRPGDHTVGALHKPQPIEPLIGEIELLDGAHWYDIRVWLDAGFTPRFTFRNGLMDVRGLWRRVRVRHPDRFPEPKRRGIVEDRFNAIRYGELPQIHIHEIEIEGPHYDEWPRPSQRVILGEDCQQILNGGSFSEAQMRESLNTFVRKAFRRPAFEDEIERVLTVIDQRRQDGHTPIEAYADGIKAVLCSSNFLYLDEGKESLSQYALATRLAYFLWSSTTDTELNTLALSNRLDREALVTQVNRMLSDPKSDAFVSGFLGSWLTLRDFGSTPPDRSQFSDYYRFDLGEAMQEETFLFARHLLDENLDIAHFIDSEFTFANKRLAQMYGIDGPKTNQFEKVALPDRRRGGLLGQASVLTVTANGIDTSPVVRGVWMLENILGTPPSPPPPDVEPLDPDIRGAKTIRDQMEKHRSIASCNECHRKIDPLGFALENFDPIGRWREKYDRDSIVDAAGELPGGRSFDDVQGLKTILLEQHSLFARALTEKLLAYALGRTIEPLDRPHVDRILEEHKRRGSGFRDLVELIVTSELFAAR